MHAGMQKFKHADMLVLLNRCILACKHTGIRACAYNRNTVVSTCWHLCMQKYQHTIGRAWLHFGIHAYKNAVLRSRYSLKIAVFVSYHSISLKMLTETKYSVFIRLCLTKNLLRVLWKTF